MFASVQPVPMFHSFVPSCGALGAALILSTAALAQTAAPATSTPSPHAVMLDEFVASASPFRRNQIDVAQSTTILSDRSLLLKQQSTLGETLAGELGVSATSFGPGASRPIIRGLGGDRIRLLENSVGTLDGSVTSPDHAVSVEPFLIERIEVVRGPASLLFGSTAVGGLVNVITHRIETEVPTERVRGGAELRYGSAAQEFSRGGVLDLSLLPAGGPALVLHLDAFRRSTGDLRIPGFAESARLRASPPERLRRQPRVGTCPIAASTPKAVPWGSPSWARNSISAPAIRASTPGMASLATRTSPRSPRRRALPPPAPKLPGCASICGSDAPRSTANGGARRDSSTDSD